MDMTVMEKNLWTSVYVATIGVMIDGHDNEVASARAAYLANQAVDEFRAAAAPSGGGAK